MRDEHRVCLLFLNYNVLLVVVTTAIYFVNDGVINRQVINIFCYHLLNNVHVMTCIPIGLFYEVDICLGSCQLPL